LAFLSVIAYRLRNTFWQTHTFLPFSITQYWQTCSHSLVFSSYGHWIFAFCMCIIVCKCIFCPRVLRIQDIQHCKHDFIFIAEQIKTHITPPQSTE
jgi:hypothetical protein